MFLSVCLSFYLSFVWSIVCPSVHPSVRPTIFLSFFLSFLHSFYLFSFFFFILFFSSRISRLNGKFGIIFNSRNPRRENEHREGFGNCFHENFGNWRDMTGKLWCLVPTNIRLEIIVYYQDITGIVFIKKENSRFVNLYSLTYTAILSTTSSKGTSLLN